MIAVTFITPRGEKVLVDAEAGANLLRIGQAALGHGPTT